MMSNRHKKRKRGSVAMEITIGGLILTGIAAFSIDLTMLIVGYGSNDAACRDAARAAGTTDSQTAALSAASLACAVHHTDGFLVSQPRIDPNRFRFGFAASNAASAQAGFQPTVSLTTGCRVRVPVLRLLAGTRSESIGTGRCYVFPALSLIQQPPQVKPIDINTVITVDTAGVPDTSGAIPGYGTSDTQGSSE